MRSFLTFLTTLALCLAPLGARAQSDSWPDKPVKIIVPFPAGGPADNSCRVLAKRLGELWGQPVVIENKPGAPGLVSATSAAPDGNTLVLGAGSLIVTAPLLNSKLAYKPQRDLVPVAQLLTNTPILTVHPSLGVKNLKELIAYAKSKPGALNYSSSGLGSPNHLMMEMLTALTGTSMVHVPYKGGAPSVAELVAGHVQLGINAMPTVLQHIKVGKLTPIAVAGAARDNAVPNVPTMTEAGVPNFEFLIWYGLFAPSRTPKLRVEKISTDIQKVLKEPEIVQQFRTQGADAAPTSPAQFAKIIQDDINVWAKLIKEKKLSLND
jgi:tripartite-type tricarboxylate transporter receptor subunit TctC